MANIRKWTDKITTLISALMCAAMMIILLLNIILRFVPGVGGVSWYMESSQYLNVWSMVIIGIQITITGKHLRVEVVDSFTRNHPIRKKVVKIINDVFIILFYVIASYSGFLLATKAKQAVSTMPQFTMGQVYWMLPIAFAICAVAGVIDLIISLTEKEDKKEVEA